MDYQRPLDQNSLHNSALVIAHPGHEIRAHRLLESFQPTVFVITDGSGSAGISRLNSTARIVESCGARAGSVFGRQSDRTIYRWIREQNFGGFIDLAESLAKEFVRLQVTHVYGDMAEGHNPAHDITRMIINVAVARAGEKRDPISNLDFPLTGAPNRCLRESPEASVLQLDDAAVYRKLRNARSYPELEDEVDLSLEQYGVEPFRWEVYRPIALTDGFFILDSDLPFYETYGRRQVARGRYDELITYRNHIEPLARRLRACLKG
ncbi:MAG: hypothetical protein ACREPW_09385 [Candidatus Binataceae bacterium]